MCFLSFLIATLWFLLLETCWNLSFIAGVFLAIVRVIGGVHFVTDVCGRGTPRGAGRIDFQLCLFDLLKNKTKKAPINPPRCDFSRYVLNVR